MKLSVFCALALVLAFMLISCSDGDGDDCQECPDCILEDTGDDDDSAAAGDDDDSSSGDDDDNDSGETCPEFEGDCLELSQFIYGQCGFLPKFGDTDGGIIYIEAFNGLCKNGHAPALFTCLWDGYVEAVEHGDDACAFYDTLFESCF